MSTLYSLVTIPGRLKFKVEEKRIKKSLKFCGKNVHWGTNFVCVGANNMSFGNDVGIGPNCVFYSTRANLTLGRGVMISPNVTIITGEHRTDLVGEFMRYIDEDTQKLSKNDKDVVIEDDCWIGSNVTILKGVTIGRGSVIHAGAVVSHNIKPYTIFVNDKLKISRFSDEEIQKHESMLKEKYGVTYPEYHPKDSFLI